MKAEDIKSRRELKKQVRDTDGIFLDSVKHGAKTAWNVFNLQARDIKQGYKEGIIEQGLKRAGLQNDENYKAEDFYRTKAYEETEEAMQVYVENELKNRDEYEAFYNNLGDNQFAKLTSNFIYGASANLLNPLEFSKNIAINAGVNAALPGAGLGLTFAGNMTADTIDNYMSNSWEDRLLGIEREPADKIINAASGALVSNAVFPAIKFGAKKAIGTIKNIEVDSSGKFKYNFKNEDIELKYKNSITDNEGTLKGLTLRDDILNPEVAKAYKKGLEEVSSVDLRYEDKNIHQSVIREVVENAPTEEGTVRVHTKQKMKEGFMEEELGVKPTVLDYTAFMRDYINQANIIGNDATKLYNSKSIFGKKFDSIEEAALSGRFKHSIEAKARDYIQNFLVNPLIITEDGYRNNLTKNLKDINYKFNNSFSMEFKNKGYYDILGEDLEDNIVANSISKSIRNNLSNDKELKIGNLWNLKSDDLGYDKKLLNEYGIKLEKDFRESVANGVTFETLNVDLHKTNPRLAKYFINSDDSGLFNQSIKDIAEDFEAGKLTETELAIILLDKETRYNMNPFLFDGKDEISFDTYIKPYLGIKTTDNLRLKIDDLKRDMGNVAMTKLLLNKPKILTDFAVMDNKALIEKLGNRIYLLEGVKTEADFSPELQRNLFHKLSETTKDVNKIAEELSDLSNDGATFEKYDLMNFIKENFVGDTKAEKMEAFLEFSDLYFRDNADMLNMMTKITLQDKASMSALGLPFYEIQNIVKNNGSFLSFLSKVPAFRKAINDNKINIEDFKHSQGHKIMDDVMMKYFSEYVDSRAIFKKEQKEIVSEAINGVIGFSRDFLLMGTGIKEMFLHPFASAINGVKYGGSGWVELGRAGLISTRTITKTLFNALEPLASMSNVTHKIHRGIAEALNGPYAKEIAMMETMTYSDNLFSKGNNGALKQGRNIFNKMAMSIQELEQKNRAVSSRIYAINKISNALKKEKFEHLKTDLQTLFVSMGIDDNDKFLNWKSKLEGEESFLKAIYQKGYSDETKYIMQGIFRNMYEEDPQKHIRKRTEFGDIVSKMSMMFTSFQRGQLNRIGNAFKYAHLSDGSYIHRWHKDAMLKNLTDGLNIGIPALIGYGLYGLGGLYVQSKITGDSQDERIKAYIKSAKTGNKEAMKELATMASEYAIPYGGIFSRYSDTAITSVGNRIWEGFTEDPRKLLPSTLELMYNRTFGEKKYKKYKGMDKQTKYYYEQYVMADKIKNNDSDGIFDFVMSKLITDELVEEGEMTRAEALRIRRENGFNDEKLIEDFNKKGLETVVNYATIKSNDDEELLNNIANGVEIIGNSDKQLDKKEIVKALDEKNNTYHDMDEYKKQEEALKYTEEEMEFLRDYEENLKKEGYDTFEILELKIAKMNEIEKNKRNRIENTLKTSYN